MWSDYVVVRRCPSLFSASLPGPLPHSSYMPAAYNSRGVTSDAYLGISASYGVQCAVHGDVQAICARPHSALDSFQHTHMVSCRSREELSGWRTGEVEHEERVPVRYLPEIELYPRQPLGTI